MRFGVPVCVGDTLEAETLVLGVEGVVEGPGPRRRPRADDRPQPARRGRAHLPAEGAGLEGRSERAGRRRRGAAARHRRDARRCPPYDAKRDYTDARAPQQPRHLLRGLPRRRRVRAHARPRRHDRSHHADGHARQHVAGALQPVDGRPGARALRRRPADRVRRHPVQSLPRHLVGRRRPTTRSPTCATRPAATPRRSSPATRCSPRPRSATCATCPGRPDLGVLDTMLRGHKFVRKGDKVEKVEIFYLERELALKRRSHYAS